LSLENQELRTPNGPNLSRNVADIVREMTAVIDFNGLTSRSARTGSESQLTIGRIRTMNTPRFGSGF
jgi:hypothetical protein